MDKMIITQTFTMAKWQIVVKKSEATQYAYLSVTYGQNDNYTDIYDGEMANCCQKVRGNKTNQRSKQQQKQNKQTKNFSHLCVCACIHVVCIEFRQICICRERVSA